MSSGFVTEQEIAEVKQRRQDEWEKVRSADQPLEFPEEPCDSRSLYERLKEQKDKKDFEYEEAHKLKNLIRGLDDDEVDFLEVLDKAKIDAERKQQLEEKHEMQDFRQKVASLQEQNLDRKIQSEVSQPKITKSNTNNRLSQKAILSGVIKKRKPDEKNENTKPDKKPEESDVVIAPKKVKVDGVNNTTTEALGAFKCIGILPGICGMYKESSDSEKSTDTEDEFDYSKYDWMGRKKGPKVLDEEGCAK
ncbi:PSME3-interacting protein [Pseudolycoriella hygida]|uniref:PSME3-interacting protein n=1 Tax=Pseudolycoriella hygida TaxID=35572 RepID=A0A9Q0MK48_9DIPT|nr:PSME3-interacting protein [Pseudolycoriella hygida]